MQSCSAPREARVFHGKQAQGTGPDVPLSDLTPVFVHTSPYEAYCPLGPGAHLLGGRRGEGESWAPIIDVSNGWVQVGSDNTCMPYNALHVVPPAWGLGIDENDSGIGVDVSHVMCCHEPEDNLGWVLEDEQKPQVNVEEARTESEQTVINMFHPVWYSRRDGYQGTVSFHFFPESIRDGVGIKADYCTFPTDHSTYCFVLTIDSMGMNALLVATKQCLAYTPIFQTHFEADLFCKNIGHKQLCPIEAYCPNGQPDSSTHDDLYLNRGPFDGEQWAPIRPLSGGATDWLLIGTLRGNPTSTCATYSQLEDSDPTWDIVGSQSEHKQHVLCCSYEEDVEQGESLEQIVKDSYNPVWFSDVSGWTGGSWNDAQSFCDTRGMQMCPYMGEKFILIALYFDVDRSILTVVIQLTVQMGLDMPPWEATRMISTMRANNGMPRNDLSDFFDI